MAHTYFQNEKRKFWNCQPRRSEQQRNNQSPSVELSADSPKARLTNSYLDHCNRKIHSGCNIINDIYRPVHPRHFSFGKNNCTLALTDSHHIIVDRLSRSPEDVWIVRMLLGLWNRRGTFNMTCMLYYHTSRAICIRIPRLYAHFLVEAETTHRAWKNCTWSIETGKSNVMSEEMHFYWENQLSYTYCLIQHAEKASNSMDFITVLHNMMIVALLNSFLGLCRAYQQLVLNFSGIAALLKKTLRKEKLRRRTELVTNYLKALRDLEQKQLSPVLELLRWKCHKMLDVDACHQRVEWAIMPHRADGQKNPPKILPRTTNRIRNELPNNQKKYLAVFWAIVIQRWYFQGGRFTMPTDDHSLQRILNHEEGTRKLAQWPP